MTDSNSSRRTTGRSRGSRLSLVMVSTVAVLGALSALWVAMTPAADQTFLVERTWEEFAGQDAEVASIVSRLLVVLGLLGTGFGTAALVIALMPYRAGERWSWFALWILPLTYGAVAVRMFVDAYPIGYFYAGLAGMAMIGLLVGIRTVRA